MRVEEFMIGFPPRLLAFRRRDTKYGVGLIPFGGFCRIAGMEPGQEAVEGGFYTRPRYAQALVIAAGSAMNVLLAVGLFTLTGVVSGVPIDDVTPPTIERINRDAVPARAAGLQPGDQIVGLDGHRRSLEVTQVRPGSLGSRLGLQAGDLIYAAGDKYVAVSSDLVQALPRSGHTKLKISPAAPTADGQPKQIAASRQALGLSDSATRADLARLWGVEFAPLSVLPTRVYVMDRPGTPIRLTIRREGQEREVTVTPRAKAVQVEQEDGSVRRESIGQIGVIFEAVRRHDVGFALTTGLGQSTAIVEGIAGMIYRAVRGKGRLEGSGVVGMAYYAHEQAQIGWDAVVQLCGIISVNLAFLNLLPIPITDGGRLVLIGYEAVVRRRISSRREMAWLAAGAVFFVCIFLAVTFKDVWNLIRHHAP
jgi:regulator of sigma E protease